MAHVRIVFEYNACGASVRIFRYISYGASACMVRMACRRVSAFGVYGTPARMACNRIVRMARVVRHLADSILSTHFHSSVFRESKRR